MTDATISNAMRSVRMWRPEGQMPRTISFDLRVQTLRKGRDPGSPLDLQITAGEMWSEVPEGSPIFLWLHPEEMVYVSMGMAGNWRHRVSQKYKDRCFLAAGRM